jgi:CHAT domain-containing protein
MSHPMKAHKISQTNRIVKLAGSMVLTLLGFQLVFGQGPKADVRRLKPGQPLRREINSLERHSYPFQLKKDEFIHVRVTPKGIDLVLKLSDASGKELVSLDSPDVNNGAEVTSLSFVAERAGRFSLEVKSSDENVPKGMYTITVGAPRAATANDLNQISVEQEQQAKRKEAGALAAEALKLSMTPGASQTALEKAFQALAMTQDWKDLVPRGICLTYIARIYQINGDTKKSFEYSEKVLEVVDSIKEKNAAMVEIEGLVLETIGERYIENLLYQELVLRFSKRLEDYQTRKEDLPKGILLAKIGDAQNRLHMFDAAELSYKEAAQVFKRIMAIILNNLGRLYFSQANTTEALSTLLSAEPLFEQSPNVQRYQFERMATLRSIENIYSNLKDFDNTAIYRAKVNNLQINQKLPDLVVLNYVQLGNNLLADGKLEDALKIFQEGLDYSGTFESIINTKNKTRLLEGIVLIKLKSGKIDEVETYVGQLTKLAEKLNDKTILANLGERTADFFYEMGRYDLAAKWYGISYAAMQATDDNVKETDLYTSNRLIRKGGKSLIREGEVEGGLEFVNAAFWLDTVFNEKGLIAGNYDELVTIYESLGNKRAAIFFGKQAVSLKQEIRRSINPLPIETQKSLLKGNRETYERLVTLLIQENRLEEAQQILEFYQNQEFYDTDSPYIELAFTPHEKTIRAELNELTLKMNELGKEVFRESRTIISPDTQRTVTPVKVDTKGKLKQVGEEFSKPKDEKDIISEIKELSELKDLLKTLSDRTGKRYVALYTFISREKFFVLLNTQDEPVQVFESPVKADELNSKLLQFYALLQSPDRDPRILGKHLYQIIIPAALEAKLRDKEVDTLMWSLDGNLRYIPVAALSPDGAHYLVERFNNVVFTRVDKERMTRKVSSSWTGYGFFTSHEKIVKLLSEPTPIKFPSIDANESQIFRTKNYSEGIIDGDVFSELEFTEQSLRQVSERKRPLIHISSHFRFYPGNPELSFLLLGDGKVLTISKMKEFKNLFQDVELLTLSACDTAAQFPNANGKEIDGLAELAQRLGAGSVMASLWSVLDVSTTRLMKGFYRVRQGDGLTKAEALRRAQLNLLDGRDEGARDSGDVQEPAPTKGNPMKGDIFVEPQYRINFRAEKGKPFAHPYYWSPFVLYGNPQ